MIQRGRINCFNLKKTNFTRFLSFFISLNTVIYLDFKSCEEIFMTLFTTMFSLKYVEPVGRESLPGEIKADLETTV